MAFDKCPLPLFVLTCCWFVFRFVVFFVCFCWYLSETSRLLLAIDAAWKLLKVFVVLQTVSRATQPPPMIGGIGRGRGFRVAEQPPIDPVNTWIAGIGLLWVSFATMLLIPGSLGSFFPKKILSTGLESRALNKHKECLDIWNWNVGNEGWWHEKSGKDRAYDGEMDVWGVLERQKAQWGFMQPSCY